MNSSPCLGSAVGRVMGRANIDPMAIDERCAVGYSALWSMGARPVNLAQDMRHEGRDLAMGDAGSDGGGDSEEEQEAVEDTAARHDHKQEPIDDADDGPPFVEVTDMPGRSDIDEVEELDVFGHGGSLDQDDRDTADDDAHVAKRARITRHMPAAAATSAPPCPHVDPPPSARRRARRPADTGDGDAEKRRRTSLPLDSVRPGSKRKVGAGAPGRETPPSQRMRTGGGQRGDPEGSAMDMSQASGHASGSDPAAESEGAAVRVEGQWGHGHRLSVCGPAIWCRDCGHDAIRRAGRGLAATCLGSGSADAAARRRIDRLSAGRHPISGEPLA